MKPKKKKPWEIYAEKVTAKEEPEDFFEDFGEDLWSCNQE